MAAGIVTTWTAGVKAKSGTLKEQAGMTFKLGPGKPQITSFICKQQFRSGCSEKYLCI